MTSATIAELVAFANQHGGCPCCELTGIPPEQGRDRNPAYFRELDSLPHPEAPIPEAPKGAHICWSCRVLAHQSAGEYGESARAFYAWAGEPVTHLLLAPKSYHHCGYYEFAGTPAPRPAVRGAE